MYVYIGKYIAIIIQLCKKVKKKIGEKSSIELRNCNSIDPNYAHFLR